MKEGLPLLRSLHSLTSAASRLAFGYAMINLSAAKNRFKPRFFFIRFKDSLRVAHGFEAISIIPA